MEDTERIQLENFNENLYVVTPYIKTGTDEKNLFIKLQIQISRLLNDMQVNRYICWYYTPMALPFSKELNPELVVYDCMDELSAFKFAPPELTISGN